MIWLKRLFLALGIFALTGNFASATDAHILDGDWDGVLNVSVFKLRLALHIETTNGTTAGTLKSVDQSGAIIPLSSIGLDGTTMSFDIVKPATSFQGALSSDGQSIAGNWMQNGSALPLTFAHRARGAAEPVVNRPQEPHPPYPYRAENVEYAGAGGITLAGTLTMPQGAGPFPAAILIAGSGPHDRDETIFAHKPFLVLADMLTRHGIAVLRSDKRGIGESKGDYGAATSEDFASDVESAIAYLKTRPEIDPKKIGLIGHSEGGLIAPMVAAKDHSVAFVVLMAGPGERGDAILFAQRHLIAAAMGAAPDAVASGDAAQRKAIEAAESPGSDDDRRAKVRAVLAEAAPTADSTTLDKQATALTSPWFHFFLTYDPAPALSAVRCPVLAIAGSKDLQVPPDENLAAIRAANRGADTVELPNLNHLFQTAKTGAPSEYSDIEETIAPIALDTITLWIEKHTK